MFILFSKYLERIQNSSVDIQKTASYINTRRKPRYTYMLIHWLFIGLHIGKTQNLDYSLRPFDHLIENGYVKFLGMRVDGKLQ